MPHIVVFSDLDGTLLDHKTYSWTAAEKALARLRAEDIPLVLASSKTSAEISELRAELGFEDTPAIVENGAGILPPGRILDKAATEHERLLKALDALPDDLRLGFEGFSDWGPEEIARKTGLTTEKAVLASSRQYSEPGLWRGAPENEALFIDALAKLGVNARKGGRFLTLSFGATKADRMREITKRYMPRYTLALGDAPNDVEMLTSATVGVIVKNPHSNPLPAFKAEANGQIVRTVQAGPDGWNDAVLHYLTQWLEQSDADKKEI